MSQGTMNKAVVIGRLGRDPQVRYTPSGIPISSFSLATNNRFKTKEGKAVANTDWHRVVAWSKLAEICGQYLKKGALVCVEGQMKTRYWDDKNGVKHQVTEIVAESMQMLGHKTASAKDETVELELDDVREESAIDQKEEETVEVPF